MSEEDFMDTPIKDLDEEQIQEGVQRLQDNLREQVQEA